MGIRLFAEVDNAMKCRIADCRAGADRQGLCFLHYWRVQRHGDPHVVLKPGRKPDPERVATSAAEVSRLHHELAGLRQELAQLRQQRAPRQSTAAAAPQLAREIAQLKGALQTADARILKLNERIKTLEAERGLWQSMSSETMRIRPGNGAITETQRRSLLAALHPDRATSPAQKRRLDEAFKIVSNLAVAKSPTR
jgi:chromosome segregation ATPase